jgi:hypothetical protein
MILTEEETSMIDENKIKPDRNAKYDGDFFFWGFSLICLIWNFDRGVYRSLP